MAEQQWEPPESQAAAPPSQNETLAVPTEPAVESELSTHDGTPTEPQSVGASPAQPMTGQPIETSSNEGAPSQSEPTVAPSAVTASDQAVREDNERLRREVESLRAKVERQSHPGRWRRGVTGVLVVLCCLGILCSMLTVWTSATFLNTESWLTIVGPIGQNPKVIQTVSTYAANEVVTLLDVQVPSNLGQIKLFQSAQLATAQQLLRLLDVLTVLLPILTAGLILATLWISPDLRRTLLQLGIGIAVTFIIVKLATGYLNQTVVSATDNNPTAQSVVQSTLQTVLGSFDTITSWLLAGGLVLAVGAFLAGKPEWFRAAYARLKQGYLWVKGQFQKRVGHTPPDVVGAAT